MKASILLPVIVLVLALILPLILFQSGTSANILMETPKAPEFSLPSIFHGRLPPYQSGVGEIDMSRFLPFKNRKVSTRRSSGVSPQLKLNAIFINGDSHAAMIGDDIVTPGERYRGYTVLRITPRKVILKGTDRNLSLQLKD